MFAEDKAKIGRMGEQAATKWLRSRGYLIRDLNWRFGRYELDIVAERWDTVHFIEVKSRKADGLTTPEEAFTHDKFMAIAKAARSYIAQYHIRSEWQFDLIAVDIYPDQSMDIRLIEKAGEFKW